MLLVQRRHGVYQKDISRYATPELHAVLGLSLLVTENSGWNRKDTACSERDLMGCISNCSITRKMCIDAIISPIFLQAEESIKEECFVAASDLSTI